MGWGEARVHSGLSCGSMVTASARVCVCVRARARVRVRVRVRVCARVCVTV